MNDNEYPDFHASEDLDYKPRREPSPEETNKNRKVVIIIILLWLFALLLAISSQFN